jgi:hypothetical protein
MYCELLFEEAAAGLANKRPLEDCLRVLYRDAPFEDAQLEVCAAGAEPGG